MSRERPANLCRYEVSAQALLLTLRDGHRMEVTEGIPTEAELKDLGYSPENQTFYMTLEHDSFDEICEGELIPMQTVECRTLEVA